MKRLVSERVFDCVPSFSLTPLPRNSTSSLANIASLRRMTTTGPSSTLSSCSSSARPGTEQAPGTKLRGVHRNKATARASDERLCPRLLCTLENPLFKPQSNALTVLSCLAPASSLIRLFPSYILSSFFFWLVIKYQHLHRTGIIRRHSMGRRSRSKRVHSFCRAFLVRRGAWCGVVWCRRRSV